MLGAVADENEEAAAVDVLAEDINLRPLLDLMANKKVLKVFHAARQDLEIFIVSWAHFQHRSLIRRSLQWYAVLATLPGYETLVRNLTDHVIDKSSRYTD